MDRGNLPLLLLHLTGLQGVVGAWMPALADRERLWWGLNVGKKSARCVCLFILFMVLFAVFADVELELIRRKRVNDAQWIVIIPSAESSIAVKARSHIISSCLHQERSNLLNPT
jgi:hypothetical protein